MEGLLLGLVVTTYHLTAGHQLTKHTVKGAFFLLTLFG